MREQLLAFLQQLPADRQLTPSSTAAKIVCPNPEHANGRETTPSFKIALTGQYAGSGYCFGCGWHGNWQKVCVLLGFSKEAKYLAQETPYDLYSDEDEEAMLGTKVKRDVTEPWPVDQDWVGHDGVVLNGQLVSDVGGRLVLGNPPHLLFNVRVNNRTVGTIKCVLFPKKDDLKYINSKGTWVRDTLFPYDYVRERWPRLDVLILTEGVRDPLRTIQNGYPSLSILGSNNWSAKCAGLVKRLSPSKLIIMMDPDRAGDDAARDVYDSLADEIETRVVRLPSKPNGKKLLDPTDLSKSKLERVLSHIKW